MKTKLAFLLLGAGLIIMQACSKYPPASERLLEDLAVVTQYDTKVNFNNYKTYDITDYIVKITDTDTTEVSDQQAQSVLAQIAQNMDLRGFVRVAEGTKPDFGIDVVYYQNTYVYTYYYDWWDYYPYWDWYYPYYPVYYSSYTAGCANIQLVDLKVVDTVNQKLYLRWNAYIRGLLTGDHTNADIMTAINQAFIQTPQLRTTAK